MITKAKYTTLKNFLVKGANLAPVDFSEIEKFEKANFKSLKNPIIAKSSQSLRYKRSQPSK